MNHMTHLVVVKSGSYGGLWRAFYLTHVAPYPCLYFCGMPWLCCVSDWMILIMQVNARSSYMKYLKTAKTCKAQWPALPASVPHEQECFPVPYMCFKGPAAAFCFIIIHAASSVTGKLMKTLGNKALFYCWEFSVATVCVPPNSLNVAFFFLNSDFYFQASDPFHSLTL